MSVLATRKGQSILFTKAGSGRSQSDPWGFKALVFRFPRLGALFQRLDGLFQRLGGLKALGSALGFSAWAV